jgi:hypothetical protein
VTSHVCLPGVQHPVGGTAGWTLGIAYPPINAVVGDELVSLGSHMRTIRSPF